MATSLAGGEIIKLKVHGYPQDICPWRKDPG
jgi:hypothetical protein